MTSIINKVISLLLLVFFAYEHYPCQAYGLGLFGGMLGGLGPFNGAGLGGLGGGPIPGYLGCTDYAPQCLILRPYCNVPIVAENCMASCGYCLPGLGLGGIGGLGGAAYWSRLAAGLGYGPFGFGFG